MSLQQKSLHDFFKAKTEKPAPQTEASSPYFGARKSSNGIGATAGTPSSQALGQRSATTSSSPSASSTPSKPSGDRRAPSQLTPSPVSSSQPSQGSQDIRLTGVKRSEPEPEPQPESEQVQEEVEDELDLAAEDLPDAPQVEQGEESPATGKAGQRAAAPAGAPVAGAAGLKTREDRRKEKLKKFVKANEERYQWLEDPQDAQGRRPGEPGYDPGTLYIPAQAQRNFTAFEHQYWEVKKAYFDTVVFFKKGKFYELFERDAEIGHRVLGLKLSERTNMKMVGLPEGAFSVWAAKLIAQGYKVTKVEQVETHSAAEKRKHKQGLRAKGEEVIRREVSQVLSVGTVLDEGLIPDYRPNYLMAIKEGTVRPDGGCEVGVCYMDASVGDVALGAFSDDASRTALQSLLLQVSPREILYERAEASAVLLELVRRSGAVCLTGQASFPSSQATLEALRRHLSALPDLLYAFKTSDTALPALGGCVAYLERLRTADDALRVAVFRDYRAHEDATHMVLDGGAIANLELLENMHDRSVKGTLLNLLDHCVTPFGKRLLRTWIAHPLVRPVDINDRLDAVEYLNEHPELMEKIIGSLRGLPDLPRLVARASSGRLPLTQFLRLLESFDTIQELVQKLHSASPSARYVQRLVTVGDAFPELSPLLAEFTFDRSEAAAQGFITPEPGEDPAYDAAAAKLSRIYDQLEAHLDEQKQLVQDNDLVYIEKGKEPFQIEISRTSRAINRIPSSWTLVSDTAKVRRYYTPKISELLPSLVDAKEEIEVTKRGVLERLLQRFAKHGPEWQAAAAAVAELDVLCSLATVSFRSEGVMTRPNVVERPEPFLDVRGMRHPCISNVDFIPNDLQLGTQSTPATMLLLTGPNMGGKSTLLRQTSIVVLMAQLGCYVPAEAATFTPVDRIFTRLGANDNILAGQSTFMVEMIETAGILREATRNSLIIVDELGRGTSTFDGYAIAFAALDFLSRELRARVLFSTHYYSLTDEFKSSPHVSLHHMACSVDPHRGEVVFLYKLRQGACPKSYGMNVAGMAGIPRAVTERAEQLAAQFERDSRLASVTRARDSAASGRAAAVLRAAASADPLSALLRLQHV